MLLCVHGQTSPRRSLAISAAVSGRSRRMTDRPNPIQIAAPPDKRKSHQQHGEEHAQDRASRPAPASARKKGSELFSRSGSFAAGIVAAAAVLCRPLPTSVAGFAVRREQCARPCQTRSPAGRRTPPRPRKSGTPAPRRRTAGRTGPTPTRRPARRTRRSPASAPSANWAAATFPTDRDASTNRNPTVANSAK